MKYKSSDLYNSIVTEASIVCDLCREGSNLFNIDEFDACEVFFKQGWRVTKFGNTYCPECAKKKLKQ